MTERPPREPTRSRGSSSTTGCATSSSDCRTTTRIISLYRPDRDDDHRRVAARHERGHLRHRRRGGRRTRRGTHRHGRRPRPRTGRCRRRGPAGKRELLPVEHRLRLLLVGLRGGAALAALGGRGARHVAPGDIHGRPSRLLLCRPFGDRRVLPARRRTQRRGLSFAPTRRGRGRRRLRPRGGPPDRRRARPSV